MVEPWATSACICMYIQNLTFFISRETPLYAHTRDMIVENAETVTVAPRTKQANAPPGRDSPRAGFMVQFSSV
jgi:hypothetical protein